MDTCANIKVADLRCEMGEREGHKVADECLIEQRKTDNEVTSGKIVVQLQPVN